MLLAPALLLFAPACSQTDPSPPQAQLAVGAPRDDATSAEDRAAKLLALRLDSRTCFQRFTLPGYGDRERFGRIAPPPPGTRSEEIHEEPNAPGETLKLRIEYDDAGRAVEVERWDIACDWAYLLRIERNDAGRVTRETYHFGGPDAPEPGYAYEYEYDEEGRLVAERTTDHRTGEERADRYELDAAGRIARHVRTGSAGERTTVFRRDATGALVEVAVAVPGEDEFEPLLVLERPAEGVVDVWHTLPNGWRRRFCSQVLDAEGRIVDELHYGDERGPSGHPRVKHRERKSYFSNGSLASSTSTSFAPEVEGGRDRATVITTQTLGPDGRLLGDAQAHLGSANTTPRQKTYRYVPTPDGSSWSVRQAFSGPPSTIGRLDEVGRLRREFEPADDRGATAATAPHSRGTEDLPQPAVPESEATGDRWLVADAMRYEWEGVPSPSARSGFDGSPRLGVYSIGFITPPPPGTRSERIHIRDPSGTPVLRIDYDDAGRPLHVQRWGFFGNDEGTTRYDRNEAGRVIRTEYDGYGSNWVVEYGYDSSGRPTSRITLTEDGEKSRADRYEYDESGRLARFDRRDEHGERAVRYVRDESGRLTALRLGSSAELTDRLVWRVEWSDEFTAHAFQVHSDGSEVKTRTRVVDESGSTVDLTGFGPGGEVAWRSFDAYVEGRLVARTVIDLRRPAGTEPPPSDAPPRRISTEQFGPDGALLSMVHFCPPGLDTRDVLATYRYVPTVDGSSWRECHILGGRELRPPNETHWKARIVRVFRSD